METDHYVVLGLPSGDPGKKLTDADIKKAYKTKARELHPDKRPNDPNANINFQKLQTSYDILKDEIKRKCFDDLLHFRVQRQRQSSQVDSRKHTRMMVDLHERECASKLAREEGDRYAWNWIENIETTLEIIGNNNLFWGINFGRYCCLGSLRRILHS
ncbi:hypothetical protein MKW98_022199 [Papaver atlanticum]|uniref:J domain-containing protein n=1 Tax=Papaver atlanticum TaxID=357466 RepID=A0AAD4XR88_9MAGN|nr:hypothetical protein MKW98_022199 [Papaver atlanticum]